MLVTLVRQKMTSQLEYAWHAAMIVMKDMICMSYTPKGINLHKIFQAFKNACVLYIKLQLLCVLIILT